MTLIAAADGSALGNPGPAGWAWYIDADRWASGGWPHGTNNMGELTAVLDLLQQTEGTTEELLIYCDSVYAINSITKWMPGWKRRGWRKGDGKPVLNVEIMKQLDAAMQGRRVRFEWVKGHSGHELNTEADRLANAAAVAHKEGREPDSGPGFGAASSAVLMKPDVTARAAIFDTPQPDLFAEPVTSDESKNPLWPGDSEPQDSDAEHVAALERSLLTDEVRTDQEALTALLHPDWCEIGRSGRLWTRAQVLAELGPLPAPVTLTVLLATRPAPGLLLLLWRASSPKGTTLRSSLWLQQSGRWRQLFHQGTAET